MEGNLRKNTTFNGKYTLMEDGLQWKITFDGTTFNGKRLLIESFQDFALPYTAVAVTLQGAS